jgi:membrane protein
MKNRATDHIKKQWLVLTEALSSFMRHNDLTAASSLAFSAMLALIPTLFLLTYLLSLAIGSSTQALARTQELLMRLLPAYSQDIVNEVRFLASHKGAVGLVNGVVLFWTMTPFVADMRFVLGTVFRQKPSRPFLLEKLFDVIVSMVFLVGLTAVMVAGIAFQLLEKESLLLELPHNIETVVLFLLVTGVVFLFYFIFSSRMRIRYLLAGAVVTALIWFAMRPAFHLFLTFNPGYGFAFGSFKSLFVVIIWIYASLVIFLFGAEIAESLHQHETVFIKKLMQGKRNVPAAMYEKYVRCFNRGSVIFSEGDPGGEMFSVLSGTVALHQRGRLIAEIPEGKCFGEISFLLAVPRLSTAVASQDVELVSIDNENVTLLMNEYPDFVVEVLRDMALRLREADTLID